MTALFTLLLDGRENAGESSRESTARIVAEGRYVSLKTRAYARQSVDFSGTKPSYLCAVPFATILLEVGRRESRRTLVLVEGVRRD